MISSNDELLSYEVNMYKELCSLELQRRNDFSDRAFKTIAPLISLIGALIWLIKKFIESYMLECCRVQTVHFGLIAIAIIINILIICDFFRTLYNYKERRINPETLVQAVANFKQNNNDVDTIHLINESLKLSYIDSAKTAYTENEKHIGLLRKVYIEMGIDIAVLVLIFTIEMIF